MGKYHKIFDFENKYAGPEEILVRLKRGCLAWVPINQLRELMEGNEVEYRFTDGNLCAGCNDADDIDDHTSRWGGAGPDCKTGRREAA